MHKFLQRASNLIRKHEYDPWQEFHLCALIVSGGNVLSTGFNRTRTHGYIETIKLNEWTSLHAEIDAIIRARKKINLRGAKLFIARMVENDKHFAMAKPCQMCMIAIKSYGIKKVYYTIDDDTYAIMKVT